MYHLPLRNNGMGLFKLGLTKKTQGRGWPPQYRVFGRQGTGEGRDVGWSGCHGPDPSVA